MLFVSFLIVHQKITDRNAFTHRFDFHIKIFLGTVNLFKEPIIKLIKKNEGACIYKIKHLSQCRNYICMFLFLRTLHSIFKLFKLV